MSPVTRILAASVSMLLIVAGSGPSFAGSKCGAAKAKAAGKKFAAKLACHAKAMTKGIAVDPDCLANAEAKFSDAFAKAEDKTYKDDGCLTVGDAGPIEAKIDQLVDDLVTDLEPRQLPSCLNPGSPGCGSCGNGLCGVHIEPSCNGAAGVCAAQNSGAATCSSDADCSPDEVCVNLSCGPTGFCEPLCP